MESELEISIWLALTYLNLSDSERELLENIMDGVEIRRVLTVDVDKAVIYSHYEFVR